MKKNDESLQTEIEGETNIQRSSCTVHILYICVCDGVGWGWCNIAWNRIMVIWEQCLHTYKYATPVWTKTNNILNWIYIRTYVAHSYQYYSWNKIAFHTVPYVQTYVHTHVEMNTISYIRT